ncbi:MAG: hypothetical protein ACPGLV_03400 [Bacteroidia bacterium]
MSRKYKMYYPKLINSRVTRCELSPPLGKFAPSLRETDDIYTR